MNNKLIYCLSVVFALFTGGVYAQESEIEIKIDKSALNKLDIIELAYGQQGFLKFTDNEVNIGLGPTKGVLLEVPEVKNDSLNIILNSFVVRQSLFYPIIIKLSNEKDILEIIQSDLDIQGGDVYGQLLNLDIAIDSLTKYILITTDPELLNEKHYYEYEDANTGLVNADGAMVPVYSGAQIIEDVLTFTDQPKLKVMVPFKNGKPVYKRERGFYFGLGAYFGGEKVEKASEEQYFRAGSGGVFSIGYSHSIGASRFVARYGGSFRFQTGEHQSDYNLGLISEGVLTYQTRHINYGIGGQYDFANTIKANGETYTFNPVFSPKVLIEARFGGYLSVGGEYIITDFKTDRDELFKGNRFGIFVRMFFGK